MPGTPSKERCTVARTNPSMYLKSILGALLSRTLKISLVCLFAYLYKYIYFLIKNREQTQAWNYVNGDDLYDYCNLLSHQRECPKTDCLENWKQRFREKSTFNWKIS